MSNLPRLLTVKQYADWFLVDVKTVYDWIYKNRVRAIRKGHTVRVIVDENELKGKAE